jgi:hypothetical protein
MNSSIAASMMAARRSAARAARLDGGPGEAMAGKGGFGALTGAVASPRRRLAGFEGVPSGDPLREMAMRII